MSKQSITYLQGKFQTGDIPTQQDFYDLFDSFAHLDRDLFVRKPVDGLRASGSLPMNPSNGDRYFMTSGAHIYDIAEWSTDMWIYESTKGGDWTYSREDSGIVAINNAKTGYDLQVVTMPASTVAGKKVLTGALTGGVPKTLSHNLGKTHITFDIYEGDNKVDVALIRKNPGNPTTQFDIEVSVDLPGGLEVYITGFND